MTDVSRPYDPATATEPQRPEASLGELIKEMTSDVSDILRKEVELAKVETREEVKKAVPGVGMMAAAAVGGLMFLTFISFALAWLLDQAMNTALAFLIVAVLWAVIAGVLFTTGRKRLRQVRPLPQTTETLKEDVQWAKTLKS